MEGYDSSDLRGIIPRSVEEIFLCKKLVAPFTFFVLLLSSRKAMILTLVDLISFRYSKYCKHFGEISRPRVIFANLQ